MAAPAAPNPGTIGSKGNSEKWRAQKSTRLRAFDGFVAWSRENYADYKGASAFPQDPCMMMMMMAPGDDDDDDDDDDDLNRERGVRQH